MATYYLNADTGNDTTGNGSSGNPWKTISKAHTSASSGDTIICQESTASYSFATQIFTKSLNIYGVNDDASGVVFDGGGLALRWYANFSATVVLDIEKITFQNITTSNNGTYQNIFACNHMTFKGNIVRNIINTAPSGSTGNGGIVGGEYQSGVQDHAIVIQGNLFYDLNGGTPALNISLHGNGGNDTGYIYWYNNTVYADGAYTTPIFFGVGSIGALDYRIKNNIFYSTISTALVSSGSALNGLFNYNSTYNCTNVPTGTGNITSDPLFVDAANDNFNLRPTSPCIDTGVLL